MDGLVFFGLKRHPRAIIWFLGGQTFIARALAAAVPGDRIPAARLACDPQTALRVYTRIHEDVLDM